MEAYNLVSFMGIFILLAFAWVCSADRRNLNWHVIAWGLGLQLLFALFVFVIPAGTRVFLWLNQVVVKVLDSASAGTQFLFGALALPPGKEGSLGFFLAFQALPTIVFFSALTALLYYYNILPRIIRGFAYIFTRFMKISGAESLCAASNIFVGVESALTVKPHLDSMTRSELCTVLTAGMATVASNVLAMYVFMLHEQFPTIAGHLISASILSAPAALVMSKIILPEGETPQTRGEHIKPHYERENSVLAALINGANAGVKLIVGIAALLLAVLGLVALVDMLLSAIGVWVNSRFGISGGWSLKGIMGYLFYPFTLVIGVPLSDAPDIAKVIGERLIVTEVTSYQDLAGLLAAGTLHNPRSAVIATYALCGFAHVASLAIFIGGVAALAPGRIKVLSQVGFRALLAATLDCLLTACMAGTFFMKTSLLLAP